jgi:hypothetical protein
MAENIHYAVRGATHYPPRWSRQRTLSSEPTTHSSLWGEEAEPINQCTIAVRHFRDSSPQLIDAELFNRLARQWRIETAAHSSLAKKVMHPAYQRIIGMGPGVITLILREMKVKPGHWFWALDALTQGQEPENAKNCKTLGELTQAWLKWGEDKGIL